MAQVQVAQKAGQLTAVERALLLLPAFVGLSIGLFPLFAPQVFAQAANFPADDVYVYQMTGAATPGYGVIFLLGVLRGDWLEQRLPTIGLLAFQAVVFLTCLLQVLQGGEPSLVMVLMVAAFLVSVLSGALLYRYRGVPQPAQDLAMPSVRIFLLVGMLAAGVFGIVPLWHQNWAGWPIWRSTPPLSCAWPGQPRSALPCWPLLPSGR
jgi:hypothetical protein